MKLTVLVPARNEARTIGPSLKQAIHALEPDELVVVDGASEDETVAVAQEIATVVRLELPRGAALNQAVAQTTGDVLLFLHADTLVPDGARAAIARALADESVVGGAFRLGFDDRGRAARLLAAAANLRGALLHAYFADQALFVRREAYLACGGFPPWSLLEDLDLVRRLRRHGRLRLLPLAVTTSARRHRRRGWLRTTLTVWAIVLLFSVGVAPERLARLYGSVR